MGGTLGTVPARVVFQLGKGVVTFPIRIVNDAWAFGTAVRQAYRGERGGWDVAWHGIMLAGDVTAIYHMSGARTRYAQAQQARARAPQPQDLIDDVVENELRNVRLTHYPEYDPDIPHPIAGQSYKRRFTHIGPAAVQAGRRETLITIVHEEMHHRLFARDWLQNDLYVEGVAQRFAQFIMGD